jgi:general secretion pathway protein E
MALPNGILLVTGPTGSGKTTSLYTALQLIDAAERKVITIEDPVEYHMARVNQIQVKPQIGLTFATILRSIVRQDPDVIMVGEMRDAETADIAVHAALTGHLVLSTLHTNSAAGALIRLIDMGIEPFLLTSTVRAVIGQRLVRTLCPHCKRARPATNDEQMSFEPVPLVTLFQPIGCAACGQTGYLGRVGLFEVMTMSDELRSLTLARAGSEALERAARAAGMQSLLQDGLGKVRQGLTTLEEVRRVVDLS